MVRFEEWSTYTCLRSIEEENHVVPKFRLQLMGCGFLLFQFTATITFSWKGHMSTLLNFNYIGNQLSTSFTSLIYGPEKANGLLQGSWNCVSWPDKQVFPYVCALWFQGVQLEILCKIRANNDKWSFSSQNTKNLRIVCLQIANRYGMVRIRARRWWAVP